MPPSSTASERAEVVVVGGGHNGLICAAYLARAGLDVYVVEKNPRCGGALFSTEADGVTLEHGGVDHSTIVASTIPEELELERHGLEYIHRTASAMHLFGDGVRIAIAETAEETARWIAAVDEADADAWMELASLSTDLLAITAELSNGRDVPMSLALRAGRVVLGRKGRPLMDLACMPVTELAHRWFRSSHMRALAVYRSQFSGLPASYPGTGAVFCLTPGGHGRRYARPKGGSRAFVEAIEAAIIGSGGRIRPDFAVSTVNRRPDGWLVGSTDRDGVLASRAVVSAIPPQVMILDLVEPEAMVPTRLRQRLERSEVITGNLSQFTLASALSRTPDLRGITETGYEGSQLWLLSEPTALATSQAATLAGTIADRPAVLATFPSVLDPTAAPGGRASMWINGFIARELSNTADWSDGVRDATEGIWATVEACLPGVRDLVTDSVFTSPEDLTLHTGALNPGFHVSATLDQLLAGRPARGCSDHRSGIDGIYLTGAGTNPGPSISGLPGRECAEALLADVRDEDPGERRRARLRAGRQEWSRARNLVAMAATIRRG